MILEFRVKNYKSIKDLQVLSMLPSKGGRIDNVTLLESGKFLANPSAAIFGRNGAGKSNLLDGINRLQELVLRANRTKEDAKIRFDPYKLDPKFEAGSTFFGLDFIAGEVKYTYEIEFNADEFLTEALSFYPKNQKAKLFERIKDKISFGDSFTGSKSTLTKLLYKNQLLLSKVKVEKIESLQVPFHYFLEKIFYRKPGELGNNGYLAHFARNVYNERYPNYSENLSRLLRSADTGIVKIVAERRDPAALKFPESIDERMRKRLLRDLEYYLVTKHRSEEDDSILVDFSIHDESMGTRRLLEIGGLMLEALHDGQALIVDEFDISLHPLLTKSLIKLFHSKTTNPFNAQLIISTQDISLFDSELFSHDQMWIVEKEYEGFSNYYSISDINGIRKNVPLQKWYLDGRFGGVPIINYSELEFEIS